MTLLSICYQQKKHIPISLHHYQSLERSQSLVSGNFICAVAIRWSSVMILCVKQLAIVLFWSLFGSLACDYDFPEIQVTFYTGHGFQVSLPADPKISVITFQGQKKNYRTTWEKLLVNATGGRFAFIQADAEFKIRDRLEYRLQVIHDGEYYDTLQKSEVQSTYWYLFIVN